MKERVTTTLAIEDKPHTEPIANASADDPMPLADGEHDSSKPSQVEAEPPAKRRRCKSATSVWLSEVMLC